MNQNDVKAAIKTLRDMFIESLKLNRKNGKSINVDVSRSLEVAISALEKQVAKPLNVADNYPGKEETECAVCGNPYAEDSYCSCCGQKIDWSGGNE